MSIFINTRIEGVSPLLMNKFTDAAAQSTQTGVRSAQIGEPLSPREVAESKIYYSNGVNGNEEPVIVIPQPNLFACIIEGGRFFKQGRKTVTTTRTSMIPACLFFDATAYPLEYKDEWCVDSRAVVNPSTRGRMLAHRPIFNDWALSFQMELDTEVIGEGLLRQVVDAAGKRIGLGDFRPDRKGPFGRFVVVHWERVE